LVVRAVTADGDADRCRRDADANDIRHGSITPELLIGFIIEFIYASNFREELCDT